MSKIKLFWEWITYNEYTLKNLPREKPSIQKAFTFWLDKHLHYYCDGLDCFLIYPQDNLEATQLVITANGNPAHFDAVTNLISSAPLLKNWIFKAFVPPTDELDKMKKGLDKPYIFKDIEIKASELKFIPFEYESTHKIDIVIYLRNYTVNCKNQNLLQVVFIVMQDLLGEKSLYENINFVELAQMPNNETEQMICLYELQFYIDKINREKHFPPVSDTP